MISAGRVLALLPLIERLHRRQPRGLTTAWRGGGCGWSLTSSASDGERHHGEAGVRRVAALVAAVRRGARPGLVDRC